MCGVVADQSNSQLSVTQKQQQQPGGAAFTSWAMRTQKKVHYPAYVHPRATTRELSRGRDVHDRAIEQQQQTARAAPAFVKCHVNFASILMAFFASPPKQSPPPPSLLQCGHLHSLRRWRWKVKQLWRWLLYWRWLRRSVVISCCVLGVRCGCALWVGAVTQPVSQPVTQLS